MSGKTSIEWATMSWNPTTGCTRVSAGCDNCYAFDWHDRRRFVPQLAAAKAAGYRNPVAARAAGVALPFAPQYDLPYSKIQLLAQRLSDPASWPEPELVFVDSMADLMHEQIEDRFIDDVFTTMERVDRHVYFVLTKRPERFAGYIERRYRGAPAPAHIWLGTSIEDERVLHRVDELREARATVRFLSCEPLLGPLTKLDLSGIHWVIAGGESGRHRRPIEARWVRELRDKCVNADVAFFFKQWGGFTAKAGGRSLDRRYWNQYPSVDVRPSPTARWSRGRRLSLSTTSSPRPRPRPAAIATA